jgi:hypothetical protein
VLEVEFPDRAMPRRSPRRVVLWRQSSEGQAVAVRGRTVDCSSRISRNSDFFSESRLHDANHPALLRGRCEQLAAPYVSGLARILCELRNRRPDLPRSLP